MKKAPIFANETERLNELKSFLVLDTAPEIEFDDITKIAAQICDVPIALVSLIDSDRQWFKSKVGLDAPQTPRDVSFCGHAIHESKVFVVEDSSKDSRFADNPLAAGAPFVRFYAGAPLITTNGFGVGTLCVIDHKPRSLSPQQVESLEALARIVVRYLESRKSSHELVEKTNRVKSSAIEILDQGAKYFEESKSVAMANFASSIAHEINNPLAIISGKVDSLLHKLGKKLITPQELPDQLQQVKTASKRASEIIKALQFVCAGSSGTEQMESTVSKLITQLQNLTQFTAESAKVRLTYQIGEDHTLKIHPVQFQQAMLNIITNAIESSRDLANAEVLVKVTSEDGKTNFLVQDNGCGIPEKLENDIFLPFTTTKAPGNGPGLGLYYAKKVIQDHGGQISILSYRQPTIFQISIPTSGFQIKSA